MDTKLEKLNKLLEIIKDDTVKPSDIQKFLVVILDVIKKSKENFDNLSSENIKTIKDSISYLEENHKKWEVTQDDKTKSILNGFDAKISTIDALSKELKKSIEEVKAIEIKDGQDADEEVIVAKVLKEIKLPEYKEVILDNGEEIVVKINDINSKEDKYKIDASHIKNLPSPIIQGSNISKSVYQLQDVKLTSLANNDTLKYNSTTQLWENGAGSGSSISLLTNGIPNASQTILNLSQGSGMTITDIGGGVVEFAAVFSPAGSLGQIQFYDPSTNLMGGIPDSYSNSTGTYFNSGKLLITTDVSDRNKAGTFDAGLLDGIYTYNLPKGSGTLPLTVNGVSADDSGEITVSSGTVNSGTQYQMTFYAANGTTVSGNTGITTDAINNFALAPTATTGAPNSGFNYTSPAHTALTASTEWISEKHNLSATIQYATGALATHRGALYQGQTISFVGASTLTNAITLQIDAPTAGTNATITNPYALFINSVYWKYGSGTIGLRFRDNTSSGLFAAAYSTNVTPSNSNHFWMHNGVTTHINATSAGTVIISNNGTGILIVGSTSVVASKLMTVTDTIAGTALTVTNSTTSAAANGATIIMSTAGQNAGQGILVLDSTTATSSTIQRALTFKKNNINADTTQEIQMAYSLRDNSAPREAGNIAFKYSNTGSGTQVTDFIWRTLQGGTTLSDAIRIRGRHLEMLTGTATGVTVAINAGTATLSTGASDHVGKVTANNTGVSTITITFGQAFTNAPSAFAYNETTPANICSVITTTTTLVITCTTVTGDKIAYGVLAS